MFIACNTTTTKHHPPASDLEIMHSTQTKKKLSATARITKCYSARFIFSELISARLQPSAKGQDEIKKKVIHSMRLRGGGDEHGKMKLLII